MKPFNVHTCSLVCEKQMKYTECDERKASITYKMCKFDVEVNYIRVLSGEIQHSWFATKCDIVAEQLQFARGLKFQI